MLEYSYDEFKAELMQDPEFRKAYEDGQPEYEAMCADIERRIAAEKQAKKKVLASKIAMA